jgi:PAS domain S-box-containing protein
MAVKTTTGSVSSKSVTKSFEEWLEEHRDSILHRWLTAQPVEDQPVLVVEDKLDTSRLYAHLLRALTDSVAEKDLLDEVLSQPGGAEAAAPGSNLSLTAWIGLLQGMRRSIIDELQATALPDQPFELLLAANEALSRLGNNLSHALQQHIDLLVQERDQYKSLYTVTYEIATNLDLDRVAQNALDGALTTSGAQAGLVLILDRESGRLFPWANKQWQANVVMPDSLPESWTQGWRNEPIPPIADLASLPEAAWQKALQVPPDVSALIVAPITANGEFYGLMLLASQETDCFSEKDVTSIRAITTQVAGVSENAEIYRLINRQAQELGTMLRHQQEEASKSQAILQSIADGVVVNNPQGQVVLLNPAAEQILNSPREHLLSTDVRRLIEAFEDPGRTEALATIETMLTKSNRPSQIQVVSVMLEVDGRVISAHMAPVIARHDEFLGVVTILRDITKEVESDRAKSEFISTVSHELRTPMTAIKGYTDLLYGGAVGSLNENQKHFLNVIQNNTGRLIALINDLLDISRIETGRVRFETAPVKLGEVIGDVVEAMAARAQERGLNLSYEVDAGIPEVMGDRDRLHQILTNLVGNAINYTPEGCVTIEATDADKAVQVSVRDTGVGIDPEEISRIFDRFYRSDDPVVQAASGTGLGLPIVKMFVEMHGGRVWVDSEKDKGSTFTFILPVRGAELEQEEATPLPITPPPIMAKTVLVVDDDPDIAQLVRLQLESNGYRVLTANRGQKALEILKEHTVDLVVLDRILPDTDGLTLLDTLKTDPDTAEIPVIMLTIIEDEGDAMPRGASAYLIKPVNEQLLLDQIEAVLTRQGRVLIVEDDQDTLTMINRALRRVGYTTDIAGDGYEALACARRFRPDVIILDLRLPGMDGYETLSHLKRNVATGIIPIIVTSAHVTNPVAERERLIALGTVDFLLKPLQVEELISTVDRALEIARTRSVSPISIPQSE